MFKRFLFLFLLYAGFAHSQQTFWPYSPPGSVSTTLTTRGIAGATDSLYNFYWLIGGRASQFYSAAQSNARYRKFADSLLNGYGLLRSGHTIRVDTSLVQTIANLFPRTDTRYFTQSYLTTNFIQKDATYSPATGHEYIAIVLPSGKQATNSAFEFNPVDTSLALNRLTTIRDIMAGRNITSTGDYIEINDGAGARSQLIADNSYLSGNQVYNSTGQYFQGFSGNTWLMGQFAQFDWLAADGLNLFTKHYINYNSRTLAFGSGVTVTNTISGVDTIRTLTVTGAAPTGTAGGDLSGSYPNPTVAKFNGQLPSYYAKYSDLGLRQLQILSAIPSQTLTRPIAGDSVAKAIGKLIKRGDSTAAAISALPTPTLQQVATSGNSYIGQIQAQNFAVTGTTGNGYEDLISQSVSPTSSTGHIRIYADSLNRLSWKNSTYRRTIRVTRASDMTISMPYRVNPIVADSTDVATVTSANYAAISLKQPRVISSDPGAASVTIAGADTVNMAVWKLQKQINTNATAIAAIPTYTASNGVNKTGNNFTSDTTYNRTVANSLSLSNFQTRAFKYVDTASVFATLVHKATVETITGVKTLSATTMLLGGFNTGAGTSSSNLFVSGNNFATPNFTASQLLFGSATSLTARGVFSGQGSTTLNTNGNGINIEFGSTPFTTATTGTHNWIGNVAVNKLGTITSGGASVPNTGTLILWGQSTFGTNNYTLFSYSPGSTTTNAWFKYGTTRVSGLQIDSTATGQTPPAGDNSTKVATTAYVDKHKHGIVTLVAGVATVSITGATTSSIAIAGRITAGGTISTTILYQASCTSGTVTITAVTGTGATDTTDTSTVAYTYDQ